MPTDSGLSHLQIQAASALARGATVLAAAAAAAVHRNTVHRWLRLKEFRDAVGAARRRDRDAAECARHERAALAVSAIRAILEDPNTPAAVRLRAAVSILNEA